MQAAEVKKRYTPEEYLALEEKAEFKSEYHDGEIVPMTGGSLNHNRISIEFVPTFSTLYAEQTMSLSAVMFAYGFLSIASSVIQM